MKRKTKQQREQEQRAALLRRLTDIYSGALGEEWTEDQFATAEILGRAVPVIRDLIGAQQEDRKWYWEANNMGHFDNPETATEFLFRNGFRA